MPELFESIPLTEDGVEGLPEPTMPYYVIAREGAFLHRSTQIGNVLIKEVGMPKTLGKIGVTNGLFTWKSEKIPGWLISQAHDFFKRTFEKHHAEAEVLITMHNETGEYRLFVPYQRVNHSGVKSVYEPTHISRDYTVVGTLHSHCDFGAFHSGTDSGDASDMDGVHFTIGYVNREKPEIVAMVAMNGKEFHYKDPSEIADIEFGTTTAPGWWDQYVFPAATQSEKPKALKSLTQAQWDEFRGVVQARKDRTAVVPYQNPNASKWLPRPQGSENVRRMMHDWDERSFDWRDYAFGAPTRESREFNKRMLRQRREYLATPDLNILNEVLDMAEKAGVFTDEDWKSISAADMDDIAYWQKFFADRLGDVATVLDALGMKTKYSVKPKGAN
jgi:hypothetical protein